VRAVKAEQVVVVLPSYCGAQLLQEHLPAILAEAKVSVAVVDDASTDGSVEMLRERFPVVRIVVRTANGGFSAAVNDGIRATDGDYVVLLNNDVEVTPGFLDSILPLFDDESVFSVGPRMIASSLGGLDEAPKTGLWHHGVLYVSQSADGQDVRPILFSSGGASVYRRSMLEQLSGFDEAYSPFYWEDADLGYRAWKRGWKSLYQPASTVFHEHSATISKFPRAFTDRVKARNSLLFIWRNISDKRLLREHRAWLPVILAKRMARRDTAFLLGWRDAFARRNEAMRARRKDDAFRRLADKDIFNEVGIAL